MPNHWHFVARPETSDQVSEFFRRLTVMHTMRFQRDKFLPHRLTLLRRQEILLQQYGLRGKEETHRARDDLFGVQNSRKALLGMLAGLQDPQVLSDKEAAEKALLAAIDADAKLKPLASAWKTITETSAKRAELLGQGSAVNSHLFGIASQLVQMAEENQKPSEERLPQFADAGRESLLQQLYSEAPSAFRFGTLERNSRGVAGCVRCGQYCERTGEVDDDARRTSAADRPHVFPQGRSTRGRGHVYVAHGGNRRTRRRLA